jgi:hypothetical protein
MLLFSHQLSIDHVLSLLIERKRAKSMHADAAAGVVSQTKEPNKKLVLVRLSCIYHNFSLMFLLHRSQIYTHCIHALY